MATPPKSTPRNPAVKKVASPVKPSTAAASAPKAAGTKASPDKAAPFVIEPEGLSSFVDQSDSALPSTKKAVATPPPPAAPPEVKAPAVKSVAAAPVAKPVEAEKPVAKTPPAQPAAPAPQPARAAVAEAAPAGTSVAGAAPVEASIAKTAPVEAPVAKAPIAEIKASSPPQPAAADKKVAAMEQAAPWQAPNALEGHYIMNEAIETSKKFAEDAKARFQTLVTDFNDKAKVAAEKSSRTAEEFSDIAKGNLEALVESSKIAAKGFETLGQNAAEYGRQSFEKTSATLKNFASVKSPTEFFQLQSELLTSAFDTLASETAKTSEAVLKLAGEIAQPLSNRYAVVSDKLKSLAA